MKRKLTQKQAIVRHIRRNGSITKIAARRYGIKNLRARMFEVRNDLFDETKNTYDLLQTVLIYTTLRKLRGTNGNKIGVYSVNQPKNSDDIYFCSCQF